MPVTLSAMSTPAPRRRIEARIRRIASLALTAVCGVIIVANVVLFLERPSTFFTDGAFGLAPFPALLVHALWWTPVIGAAAVLVVGTMPEAAKGTMREAAEGSPPVDPLPRRLPMVAAVVVLCVAVACIAVPSVTFLASIVAVVLAAVF